MLDRSIQNDHPFNAILAQDPLGCTRKMVCSLAATKPNLLKSDERYILEMIR